MRLANMKLREEPAHFGEGQIISPIFSQGLR